MKLKPIKQKKIYEEIIEQIRLLMSEGQLQPGDRLPSERELALQLKVSRPSVREALSALEMMSILEIRSGEGTFVRSISGEPLSKPLSWMISTGMEREMIAELLEVRKMMELQTVTWAALRASPQEIREIQAALQAMEEDLLSDQLGDAADHRFHYAIAQASHNQILLRLMNAISDTLVESLKASRLTMFAKEGMPQRLYQEHLKIFEAIRDRNVDKASATMLEHLFGVEKELLGE